MTWLFLFLKSRNGQIVALVIACGLVALGLRVWLDRHDAAVVRADREAARLEALEKAREAAQNASMNQMERDNGFQAKQDELANSASPDDYLRRLRAQQNRDHPTTR